MPITHVNTQITTGTALTGSVAVTKPTGLAVGDVMLAFLNVNNSGLTSTPSGWTRLSQTNGTANVSYTVEVWYVVATSTQTAASSFTWTNTDATSPMWAAITAWRGVDQNSPIHTSAVGTVTAAVNPVTTPGLTTTLPCRIVHFRSVRNNNAGVIATFTSGATSERFDGGNAGASVAYSGAAYDSNADSAAGSITGLSITNSGSSETDGVATTIALRVADTSASAGNAAATATANDATVQTGISVNAGNAAATATAFDATRGVEGILSPTAAALDATVSIGTRAENVTATATAADKGVNFGAPPGRTMIVGADSRVYTPAAESRTYLIAIAGND